MPPESPRPRPLRFLVRGGALALAGFLALDPAPGRAEPMEIGSPTFDWYLSSLLFKGPADYTDEVVVDPPLQVGGAVDDAYEAFLFPDAEPDAAVSSSIGAETFWVSAESHAVADPIDGDPVGGKAVLRIRQSFRKDEDDGWLSYKLTAVKFVGLDPSNPNDDRMPSGFLLIDISTAWKPTPEASPIYRHNFMDIADLTGLGHGWYLGPTSLPLVTTAGGLDQAYVELSLSAPFTLLVDISEVPMHGEFTLDYSIAAFAVDTVQLDTGINIYARDPAEPGSGSSFEYAGLTPTDDPLLVPEPRRAALTLTSAALLLGLRALRGPRPRAA